MATHDFQPLVEESLSACAVIRRPSCLRIVAAVVASLLLSGVRAEHVDVAPIAQEVIDAIHRDYVPAPTDPVPAAVAQRLTEAESILRALIDAKDASGRTAQTMLLEGVVQQLTGLQQDAITTVREREAALQEQSEEGATKSRAKSSSGDLVQKRFDTVISALEAVISDNSKAQVALARKAHELLLGLRHNADGRRGAGVSGKDARFPRPEHTLPGYVPSLSEPIPTFTQQPPVLDDGGSEEPAPPPAYTLSPRAPLNMYAAASDYVLAAAPVTPYEASSCNYVAADLAQNTDAQLTQEIRDLAQKLNYSPARIVEYVSNNIDFEPYFGSLKGAVGTLTSGAGNATDHASLTIALLRASNIPARYVKGRIQFVNDQRLLDWVGAKTAIGAANILAVGQIPTSTNGTTTSFSHVWVEACVPYGNYRGATFDNQGHHWIPLDPSFKNKSYQAGISVNVPFDYTNYMSTRRFDLPNEYYEQQVSSHVKTVAPNYANNTLDDVPYAGKIVPQKVDILPSSLPYEVQRYEAFITGGSAEAATLPAEHRYSFKIEVGTNASLGSVSLTMPQSVLQRVTLGFEPLGYTSAEYNTALNNYKASLDAQYGAGSSIYIASVGQIFCLPKYAPKIRVDGTLQTTAAVTNSFTCNYWLNSWGTLTTADRNQMFLPKNTLKLTVYTGQGTAAQKQINTVTYTNISSVEYHALLAYAFQSSDRLLAQKSASLLAAVRASGLTVQNENVLGAYLDLVGLKYMRYISDAARRIGALTGESGWSGNHLGLTSSRTDPTFLFDLPFGVKTGGFLIDVPGGQMRSVNLSTGVSSWETFLLSGYAGSAYESYVWQENARMDAVSSVRGIQFARDQSIPVLTINQANLTTEIAKLTNNSNTAYNYPTATVNSIKSLVNGGSTVTIPRQLLQYDNWKGQVYIGTKGSTGGAMSATFAIGQAAGGYTTRPPLTTWYDTTLRTGWDIPTTFRSTSTMAPSILSSAINYGSNYYTTLGGDPVNMVTGNMYHTEKDITIKGRGLPLVLERTYNSMMASQSGASSVPLGYGWTHSFNHYLEFKDDNFDNSTTAADTDGITSSVTWVDGSGARRFIKVAGTAAGVAVGAPFTAPEGFYFTTSRITGGTYTIREKNGTTYTFQNVAGTNNQKARLESIRDRNGNTLTLTYSGVRLNRVTDGLGHYLEFGYDVGTDDRIDFVRDWTGRRHEYRYDAAGDLTEYRSPLAVAGTIPPVTYSYYNSTNGANINHAMRTFSLPRGNGMTFEYYMNGKVFRHTNTKGESITFTYNDFRREATTVNERGFVQKYFFDEKGNPTQTVEQGGGEHRYAYDPTKPMNRTSETDPMGYVTNYQYDASGNVTTTTHPGNVSTVNSNFDSFHQPGKVKDPNGNYTLYKYDVRGNRTDVIKLKAGIGAAIVPSTYNPAANPNDLLAWTKTTYDSFGNPTVVKQVRDFATETGPTVEYDYNDATNAVVGLNATTITRCGDRDGDGIINRAAECDSENLGYDALGRQTDGIDGNWYRTHTDYDAVDRVVGKTDSAGNLRQLYYDQNGNPLVQQLKLTRNGTPTLLDQTSTTYDMSDRVESTVDAAGFITSYQYDAAGNLTKVINPDGYSLDFEYDANNNVIRANDQEGHTALRDVDVAGRVRSMTDPNGNQVRHEYYGPEKQGRLKRQYDAIGRYTEFDYDANGNVTRVTASDPTGTYNRVTLTQYDAANRPVRIAGPVYTDAVLGMVRPVTKYTYDNLGNVRVIHAGHTDSTGTNAASDNVAVQETSTFDDLGRRLTQSDPLNKTWRYGYDVHSNVRTITDPKNQIVDRTYHYGGRLDVQTVYRTVGDPNPHVTDYNYDELGQVTRVSTPEVVYTYHYDAAHRMTAVLDGRGGKRLEYRYSPGGMLDALVDGEGNQTDYLYDAVGRMTGIWAANGDLASFVRDAGGRVTEKWFNNNSVNSQYSYNADNSLAQIVNRVGTSVTPISQHDYTYDGFGNRGTARDLIGNITRNTRYQYDELNRLTAVRDIDNADALIEGYSYDPLSRRRSVTDAGGAVEAYVYDAANQLSSVRQGTAAGPVLSSFGYDDNGNMTSKVEGGVTLGLTYDALDRLASATRAGLPNETYAYDHQGRRIEKTVGGAVTRYRYAGQNILAEYDGDWTEADVLYTHGAGWDAPLLRATSAGMAEYYHADGLGSVVSVTDMTGAVQSTARYDAWGNTVASTGAAPRYGYTGREPDATGLIYYRARYYDPGVGRFTQRDPKGFIDGINRYAYAVNNPVNYTDPQGMTALSSSMINQLTSTSSYYSSNLTSAAAGAYYSQVSSSSQSLGRSSSSSAWSTGLDWLQTGLDVAGMVPGLGEVADLVNAGISVGRGNYGDAALSLGAMVPFVGAAATTTKWGGRGMDALSAGSRQADSISTPMAGQTVYRVYGGDSLPGGASWTMVNPASVPNYRDLAGLPSGGASGMNNTGRFVIEGTLMDPSLVVKTRSALSLDGNAGGLPEFVIPNWMDNGAVKINRVSGVNPEF